MCYFLINILKIAISARRSVIIHQISAFVILLAKTSFYSNIQLFLLVGMQGSVLSPSAGTLATLLILTLWFMKGV